MSKPAATVRNCPPPRISQVLSDMRADEAKGMKGLDEAIVDYPSDPRLRFLKGSLLAGRGDFAAARTAMRDAVDLAPDYSVARFQLGVLCLTSGDASAALAAWAPLRALADDNYLRKFVLGLSHLIRDEFADAIRLLEEGIEANNENLPMNRDMQLIIDQVRSRFVPDGGAAST